MLETQYAGVVHSDKEAIFSEIYKYNREFSTSQFIITLLVFLPFSAVAWAGSR